MNIQQFVKDIAYSIKEESKDDHMEIHRIEATINEFIELIQAEFPLEAKTH